MAFNYDNLSPSLKRAVDAANERDRRAKQKRDEPSPLVSKGTCADGMVDIPGPLLVRIIRRFPSGRKRAYDDDNFSGGCKELRDSIAAALGRKGDSEEDGLTFEYVQERAEEQEVVIEFYRKED